ncbi:hypothetical protein [Brachybacterium alimentarium]|uniref:hypothetical protein n=1 Tax=Brachybacterium alimentarium TaxID=47845 RepID=UPI003FD5EBA4
MGLREKLIAPIPVAELVDILEAALGDRPSRQTVAVTGAESLMLSEAVRRVARVVGCRVAVIPAPVAFHYALGHLAEWTMRVPLVATAQVHMLAEGVGEATQPVGTLPDDLQPRLAFTNEQIQHALPESGGFIWRDLRIASRNNSVYEHS